MPEPIISVTEARQILGANSERMSDEDIVQVISTFDLLAQDALSLARKQIQIKKDAAELASLCYDIYQDQKRAND